MHTESLAMGTGNDWAMALDVQQRFMQQPVRAAGAFDSSAHCRQMHALGGDFYYFVPLGGNRLALGIGDASGKGLAAALMIANVQSSLRTAALFGDDDIAAMLGVVNQQVHASSLDGRYATLFYGVFDGATRTLRYVNAGHNPPMILRWDGSVRWLESSGAPVGLFEEWPYEERTVQLSPGDLIVAYTDGVVETTGALGEDWGAEGLRRVAAGSRFGCASDVVDAIFAAMDEFTEGCQRDDATVAVLRVS